MRLGLENKNVFISASTKGIGKAIAEAFLLEGANVIINGRNEIQLKNTLTELEKTYGGGKVFGMLGDMSDAECIKDISDFVRTSLGSVDILIGNLGTGKAISDNKFSREEWEYMFKMNLFSSVELIDNFLPLFSKDGGSIILISSLAAFDRIGAPPAYAAAKAGIVSLIKYASNILQEKKIRVNGVAPGNILFEGGRWEELKQMDENGIREYIDREVPMKRFGAANEVADAVVFLASERATFITGVVLNVDGGQRKGY